MKAKLALLVVLAAGLIAIWSWRESRLAQEALDVSRALVASRGNIASSISAAEARLVAAEKSRKELQVALDPVAPAKVAAPAKKTFEETMAEFIRREEQREKDPQVQLRQMAAMRTKLVARYGPLYWKLQLTPERIERFETIVAKRDEQYQDLWAAVAAQGVKFGDAEFVKLYQPLHAKIDDDYHTATKELFGEADYQQLQSYERELPARSYVQSVAGASAVLGTAFSPQQAEQLVGIVAQASANYRKGRDVNSLDVDWAEVDARARDILSTEQMTALQTLESVNGSARPWLQFQRALNDARNADQKQTAAAAKPAG